MLDHIYRKNVIRWPIKTRRVVNRNFSEIDLRLPN